MSNMTGTSDVSRLQSAIVNLEMRHEKIGDQPAILQRTVLRGLGAGHVFTAAGTDAVIEAIHALIAIIPATVRTCLEAVPLESCQSWAAQRLKGYELNETLQSASKASKLVLFTFIGPCAILWSPLQGVGLHRSLGLRVERIADTAWNRLQRLSALGKDYVTKNPQAVKTTALVLSGCILTTLAAWGAYMWFPSGVSETPSISKQYPMPEFLRQQCPLPQSTVCSWDEEPLPSHSDTPTLLQTVWGGVTWLPRLYCRWIQMDYEEKGCIGFVADMMKATVLCAGLAGIYFWEFVALNTKWQSSGDGTNPERRVNWDNNPKWPIIHQWKQLQTTEKGRWCLAIVSGIVIRMAFDQLISK